MVSRLWHLLGFEYIMETLRNILYNNTHSMKQIEYKVTVPLVRTPRLHNMESIDRSMIDELKFVLKKRNAEKKTWQEIY